MISPLFSAYSCSIAIGTSLPSNNAVWDIVMGPIEGSHVGHIKRIDDFDEPEERDGFIRERLSAESFCVD